MPGWGISSGPDCKLKLALHQQIEVQRARRPALTRRPVAAMRTLNAVQCCQQCGCIKPREDWQPPHSRNQAAAGRPAVPER
jgi:hypothetical protein